VVNLEQFSRLVGAVHGAAGEPDRWSAVVDDLRRAVGGTGAAVCRATDKGWVMTHTTLPADAAQSYAAYYHRLDRVVASVADGPVAQVRTAAEVLAPHARSEFHTDWLRPNDIEDGLFVRLADGPRPTCFIAAAPRRASPFDDVERIRLLDALVPHLRQALRTQSVLDAAGARARAIAGALGAVRHAVIVVAADGRIVEANAAAENLLRRGAGLTSRGGRLVFDDNGFRATMAAAVRGGARGAREGGTCVVPRGPDASPYVVHVLPLRRDGAAAAAVIVVDPDRPPLPTQVWRRLFGLTGAETDVAARLAAGASLREVADALTVSVNTVRTHVAHLYAKTDTHRQAELVRVLLACGATDLALPDRLR
jgi:DNA-binding CsgD family transcriptional regulator/PAS domain-containing protein